VASGANFKLGRVIQRESDGLEAELNKKLIVNEVFDIRKAKVQRTHDINKFLSCDDIVPDDQLAPEEEEDNEEVEWEDVVVEKSPNATPPPAHSVLSAPVPEAHHSDTNLAIEDDAIIMIQPKGTKSTASQQSSHSM